MATTLSQDDATASGQGTYDYTAPADAALIYFEIDAAGGEGGENSSSTDGGDGGAGGHAEGVFSVSGGENFTIELGGTPTSPFKDGGSGGKTTEGDADGGDGGGASRVIEDATTTDLLIAEGGGGGGSGYAGSVDESAGGGGGARGGSGGTGTAPGGDGAGTGAGGDGGDGAANDTDPGDDGTAGGASADGSMTEVVTTTGGGASGGPAPAVAGGDPSLVVDPVPEAPTGASATAHTDTTITVSWDDMAYAEDYRVHASTTQGFTPDGGSLEATVSGSTTSYQITGLDQGTTYYIVIESTNNVAEPNASSEVSQTTDAPAPTFDSLSLQNGDELVCQWTDNGDDETAYRVLLKYDGGSFSNESGDLAASTTSHTTSEQLDGEQYTVKIRAVYADTISDSGTKQITTDLPDVTGLSGDATVEDEITLSWDDVTDNGEYRIQHRVAGSGNSYTDDGTVGEATTQKTITGLADGEQYDFRVRSETEHVDGSYQTIQDTTLLPAPTNVTITGRQTDVDASWTDNADNEDGYRLQRDDSGFVTVDSVSPNTTTASDTSPVYYTRKTYRVQVYTEHVVANSATVTTVAVRPENYYVEFGSASSPTPVGPEYIGELSASLEHTAVSGATVSFVPGDTDYEDKLPGEMRLYWGTQILFDGSAVLAQTATGQTRVEAEGKARTLEEDTVQPPVSYSNTPVYKAIEDYWGRTSWSATVYTPPVSTVNANNTLFDLPSSSDFNSELSFATDYPANATANTVEMLQTCWFSEAENGSFTGSATTANDGLNNEEYSNGEAAQLDAAGQEVTINFTPDHDIPSDDFEIKIRYALLNFEGKVFVKFEDDKVAVDPVSSPTDQSASWGLPINFAPSSTVDSINDLDAGQTYSVSVKVEVDDNSDFTGGIHVDCIAPHDLGTRHIGYNYTFDNTVDTTGSNTLSGPELYPDYVEFTLLEDLFYHVNSGDLSVTISDTSNNQELGVSPNGGTDEKTAQNASSLTADFDALQYWGSDAWCRVRLSRHDGGSNTDSPTDGDARQDLTDLSYTVDTDDLALFEEAVEYNADTHLENLQQLHDRGAMRFVVDHRQDGKVAESFDPTDSNLVKTDDWTVAEDGVDRERDVTDYANEIVAYGDGEQVTITNSGEVTRVGTTITRSRRFSTSDRKTLIQQARAQLLTWTNADQIAGRLQIAPKFVLPGYPYEPASFNNERVALETVSFSASVDGARASLDFGPRRGIARRLNR